MPIESVPLELGGKTVHLKFDFNALCLLEDALKLPIAEIGNMLSGAVKAQNIRALLWAGLVHENEALTLKAVGSMIEAHEIGKIAQAIGRAFTAAFEKTGGELKNAAGRQTKIGGTGKSS